MDEWLSCYRQQRRHYYCSITSPSLLYRFPCHLFGTFIIFVVPPHPHPNIQLLVIAASITEECECKSVRLCGSSYATLWHFRSLNEVIFFDSSDWDVTASCQQTSTRRKKKSNVFELNWVVFPRLLVPKNMRTCDKCRWQTKNGTKKKRK